MLISLYQEPQGFQSKEFSKDILLALLSAFFGTLFVITILDHYYKDLRRKASIKSLLAIKLKTYSDFLLILEAIEKFLKGDPLFRDYSIGRLRVNQRGEKSKDVDLTIKDINLLIEKINQLKEQEIEDKIDQLKMFDYYLCFINLMDNINLNLENIHEFSTFIHPDDFDLKFIFQKITAIKQNLQELQNYIIENSNIKDEGLSDDYKKQIVNCLDLTKPTLQLYLLECILQNLIELLKLLNEICILIKEHNFRDSEKKGSFTRKWRGSGF